MNTSGHIPVACIGPVHFGMLRNTRPQNFMRGVPSGLVACNFGGPGRGIFVIAEGEIMDRGDIVLHSACLRAAHGESTHPAGFVPACYEGRPVLRADFADFNIPAGINADGLPDPMKIEFDGCVIFHFTVDADAPVENLILRIVPMENPGGEFVFRQADCDFSSADMEEMHSGKISFRELMQRKRTFD